MCSFSVRERRASSIPHRRLIFLWMLRFFCYSPMKRKLIQRRISFVCVYFMHPKHRPHGKAQYNNTCSLITYLIWYLLKIIFARQTKDTPSVAVGAVLCIRSPTLDDSSDKCSSSGREPLICASCQLPLFSSLEVYFTVYRRLLRFVQYTNQKLKHCFWMSCKNKLSSSVIEVS